MAKLAPVQSNIRDWRMADVRLSVGGIAHLKLMPLQDAYGVERKGSRGYLAW